MRRRIFELQDTVPGSGKNALIRPKDDGTNRHLTTPGSEFGFGERLLLDRVTTVFQGVDVSKGVTEDSVSDRVFQCLAQDLERVVDRGGCQRL